MVLQLQVWALMLLQEGEGGGISFDPRAMWGQMGWLARSIVDEPEAVVIETGEARGTQRLSLHVAPGDMGRVIGKRGRVAQAIRTVVRAAAARDGADASVDIVD